MASEDWERQCADKTNPLMEPCAELPSSKPADFIFTPNPKAACGPNCGCGFNSAEELLTYGQFWGNTDA
jgi:hypothetical protein